MNCKSIDILAHHGVKGQKWGVRNGPPYPIEDKVLKKGTRLNSVSRYDDANAYKKSGNWMYTYNANDEWDSKVYKGPFSIYKIQMGAEYLTEHQYEVVKDLKMPTKQERVDEFINLYTDNKRMVVKDLTDVQKSLKKYNVGGESGEAARNVNLKKLKTKEDYEAAYEVFNHAMETGYRYKTTRAYSDIMSKKYDAMVDDNNQGIYNNAHDPVIIFRADEVLKAIGSTPLEWNEIKANTDYVRDELAKQGKRVKL